MSNLGRQRGLSMITFLMAAAVVMFMALVAMRLVPAYLEYFSIKRAITDISSEPNSRTLSNAEIREKFAKRALIDNIDVIKPADLLIERSDGAPVISVEYAYQAPLIANISLLVDFKTSAGNGSTAP